LIGYERLSNMRRRARMSIASRTFWKFQTRLLLNRLGLGHSVESWRLRRRFARGVPHEADFHFFRHFEGSRLFLDVGANLGQSALSFRSVNRSCPILSFEPNVDLAPALRGVKRLLGDSFEFRTIGLGARTERRWLFVPMVQGVPLAQLATSRRECLDDNPDVCRIVFDWAGTDRFAIAERPIDLIRGDELELAPSLIKIDVEGAELDVLIGLERTLARQRPIILTEGCGGRDFLGERGYRLMVYRPGTDRLEPPAAEEAPLNCFFVPEEALFIQSPNGQAHLQGRRARPGAV
jgi:FkbM family methyltransferase